MSERKQETTSEIEDVVRSIEEPVNEPQFADPLEINKFILVSPSGYRYEVSVSDSGNLQVKFLSMVDKEELEEVDKDVNPDVNPDD